MKNYYNINSMFDKHYSRGNSWRRWALLMHSIYNTSSYHWFPSRSLTEMRFDPEMLPFFLYSETQNLSMIVRGFCLPSRLTQLFITCFYIAYLVSCTLNFSALPLRNLQRCFGKQELFAPKKLKERRWANLRTHPLVMFHM